MRKAVGGFGKRSCVSTGVRKPGNTYLCVTEHYDMTLAVKMVLNPNTINQSIYQLLTLYQTTKFKIQSKFNVVADDKIIVTQRLKFVFGRIENIVEKEENTGYLHFLFFPQCFQKLSFPEMLKIRIVR